MAESRTKLPTLKLKPPGSRKRKEEAAQPSCRGVSFRSLQGRPAKVIPATEFRNGTLLSTMANEYLIDMHAQRLSDWPAELTVGTLCSGSEIAGLCLGICRGCSDCNVAP